MPRCKNIGSEYVHKLIIVSEYGLDTLCRSLDDTFEIVIDTDITCQGCIEEMFIKSE